MSPMLMMLSRKVRRVPMDWQHPTDERGDFVPLLGRDWATEAEQWDREKAEWDRGEYPYYADEASKAMTFEAWDGPRPVPEDYMPVFPADAELGICMYEDVTEGTPISPVYPDSEQGRSDMAEYLAAHPAGISDGMTADDWLAVIGGYLVTKDIHTGKIDAR
jgi:hypothetical protein